MAVVDLIEMWSGKIASGDGISRSATRMWTATVSAATDNPTIIQKAYSLGVPRKGDLYPGDSLLRCEAPVDVRPLGPLLYQVTATYKTPTSTDETQTTDDPISRPASAEWSFVKSDVDIDTDASGKPLTNANGEPFDPPLTRAQNDPVLTITRNERSFNPALATSYMAQGGAVNKGGFYGSKPGQARIENITASSERTENGRKYVRVTYEIHFREDGWKRRVLHKGFTIRANLESIAEGTPIVGRTKDPAVFIVRARDAKGMPVAEPVLLNAAGWALGPNESAVYLTFDIHPTKDFSRLGLQ